jgi:sulfur-carrier protein adenylyltransferase/sulfurtransferase
LGKSLSGYLLTYNALTNDLQQWQLKKNTESDALVPATVAELRGKDYAWECGVQAGSGSELEIDVAGIEVMLEAGNVILLDIREPHETPSLQRWPHEQVPLAQLLQNGRDWNEKSVVFICQSGKRSLTAANWAKTKYDGVQFYSLQGGVLGLD